MSVDEEAFKNLMGKFATGVSIVTTEQDGRRQGLTVSDFASVSLSPPLVLINIEKEARTHETLQQGAGFTVNFLDPSQKELCLTFAQPGLSMDQRFSEGEFVPSDAGGPYLKDALAWFVCEQEEAYDGGDHTIFVGRVQEGETSGNGDPLLYYDGDFGRFKPSE